MKYVVPPLALEKMEDADSYTISSVAELIFSFTYDKRGRLIEKQVYGPIIQTNDYYPFGLQTAASYSQDFITPNNRLYNAGSELNEQTQNFETFYRHYDPALGRFNGVDIKATSFASITPYQYAFNNPISYNDPMGDRPYWASIDRRRRGSGKLRPAGFRTYGGEGGTTRGSIHRGSGGHWADRGFGSDYYGGGRGSSSGSRSSSGNIVQDAWNRTCTNCYSESRYSNGSLLSFRQTDDYYVSGDGYGNGWLIANFGSGTSRRKFGNGVSDGNIIASVGAVRNAIKSHFETKIMLASATASNGGDHISYQQWTNMWNKFKVEWNLYGFGTAYGNLKLAKSGYGLMGDDFHNETIGNKTDDYSILNNFSLNYPTSNPSNVYEEFKDIMQGVDAMFGAFESQPSGGSIYDSMKFFYYPGGPLKNVIVNDTIYNYSDSTKYNIQNQNYLDKQPWID